MTSTHVDPWAHREADWPGATPAQVESLLALSNGYLGIRGTLDEGEPAQVPGTYLNGFYEQRPIRYAERGYGDPELDQVLLSVADGTRMRLAVEDEPLDLRTGEVVEHERRLDLRSGILLRSLRWRSPGGHEVRVRSRRLVSLRHRELAAIEYEVEPTEHRVRLELRSELTTARPVTGGSEDPRTGASLPPDTLVPRLLACHAGRAVLAHQARLSGHVVAAGMEHQVLAAPAHETGIEGRENLVCWSLSTTAAPGQAVRLVKLLAYHWAPGADPAALHADVTRSLDAALARGFGALAAEQRAALDHVWERADIELDGDPEIQHALRYGLFQLHQNAACASGRAIPAKGLTGPGYNGHTFWDMEIFLLPVLTYCAPDHAAEALRWRASTLPAAREKAQRLGLRGAAFAWRTIGGEECSGYLPAGTAAFHVSADVAYAAARHVAATGDARFERDVAAPLLVETARLWLSLGHHDARRGGRFSIDGVTGPDEYSPLVDNNAYTNLMAQANLRAAADVVDRCGAAPLGVTPDEPAAWRRAADAMTIPYDPDLGIHLQDEDFGRHAAFDFEHTPPERYPLLLHVPYFELYRRQVVKQPDLVLAMFLCGDAFSAEQKRRNFAYYEALTVRDSSLSPGTQAVLAAEVGDIQLAYDYMAEAALLDHGDFMRNTGDGLHLAALAGGWLAAINGLAGARDHDGRLAFSPRLPRQLSRLAFPFTFQSARLHVEVTQAAACYRLDAGARLEFDHWGEPVALTESASVVMQIPQAPPPPALRQPAGRAPARRAP